MRQLRATPLPAARPRRRGPKPPRLGGRPLPRWLRRSLRYGMLVLALGAACGGGFTLWRSGTLAAAGRDLAQLALESSANLGLKITELTVDGAKETPHQAIIDALGIRRDMPLFALDLAAAKNRVEALPWVRKASLERRWPNQVLLQIEERQPMALWQRDRQIVVIDRDGRVIEGADIHRFAGLPMVVGTGAAGQAANLLAMLATAPALAQHLSSAVWVGNRRWNLEFREGVEARLPETDPAAAVARLAALERTERLLARDIVMIDLRQPDRMIVRLAPDAAQRLGKGGKNT